MVDVTIYENFDGGDLALINNDLAVNNGLSNLVYLALFGGQNDWWGNSELDLEFNSEFEQALKTNPLTISGLTRLESIALSDLDFLKQYGELTVVAELLGINKLKLSVTLDNTENVYIWDGQKNEVIYDSSDI